MCTIIKKIHEIRRRLADDPCIAVVEEEPRGLRGVVADELEVAVAETAGPNAEGEVEGDVATHLATAAEHGSGRDGHIADRSSTSIGGPSGWSGWSVDHPVGHPSTIHHALRDTALHVRKQGP